MQINKKENTEIIGQDEYVNQTAFIIFTKSQNGKISRQKKQIIGLD